MTRFPRRTRAGRGWPGRSPCCATWNYRWGAGLGAAVAGDVLGRRPAEGGSTAPEDEPVNVTITRLVARHDAPTQKLAALSDALARLQRDFGWWQVPWGEINRFQRISPAIDQPFSDAAPSIPVPFAVGTLGLARLVRRSAQARHEALVRDQRQQLRRGGRVRAAGSAPARSPPAAKAAIPPRRTSTTRRSATRPERCARSISIPTSSAATPSGATGRASKA